MKKLIIYTKKVLTFAVVAAALLLMSCADSLAEYLIWAPTAEFAMWCFLAVILVAALFAAAEFTQRKRRRKK